MTQPTEDAATDVWDAEAFLTKAKRYIATMLEQNRDDWRFALWSAFGLEQLLRAALSDFDPVLLADTRDQKNPSNLFSALGLPVTAAKFFPKSINVELVIERLRDLVADFDPELAGFCKRHTSERNSELHSAQAAFDGVKSSTWLPIYYKACKVLMASLERELAELLGDAEAAAAEKMIAALADQTAKAAKGTVAEFAKKWADLDKGDQATLSARAALWAQRYSGHKVTCPACNSNALVHGEPISEPVKTIKGDVITETQEFLPHKFECVACRMKLVGLSQLQATGVADVYKHTQSYDAAEYYAAEDQTPDWEPDNNEPY